MLTDHVFSVPLDHDRPDGQRIEVFAREVVAADRAAASLPWLVFLQGGPGFGAPRPHGRDSWLGRALADYRVLLLDQRGTGRSTPASRQTLAGTADDQARYLAHFRADAIVRDAELIRQAVTGGEPWSVLGQSFGGFCTVTYLSLAPEGLREAFITGGLPGLDTSADDLYRLTYGKVRAKTGEHYRRYPDDAARPAGWPRRLRAGDVRAPRRRTAHRGGVPGPGADAGREHRRRRPALPARGPVRGQRPVRRLPACGAEHRLSFAAGPLYAVLHEACYAQGTATRWSAQRIRAEFGEFDPAAALDGDGPLLFTGEMIYPWMFDTDPVLRPLRGAADALAEREDWPPLYDAARLAANEVPVAAAIYFNDMYVPAELSVPTGQAIRGLKAWVTSEYEHNGLRVSNGAVLDRLIALARGTA